MKIGLLILSFLFVGSLWAQTQTDEQLSSSKRIDYQINWKYRAGRYLLFDCERKHYACVDEDGNDKCSEEREFALSKKAPSYPCAPLQKFKDKATCLKKNYAIVDLNAIRRFCYPK